MYRWSSVSTLALSLVLSLLPCVSSRAQAPSIPSSIITAQTITAAQQQQIERIVTPMLQQLATGSDEQVAEARQSLLGLYDSAMTLQGTPAFFAAMSQVVAQGLEPAAQSDRIICRINAMILASRALSPGIVTILKQGLEDPMPAIRYAATKAAASMLDPEISGQNPAQALTNAQYLELTNALSQVLSAEANAQVAGQAVTAMSRIPLDSAKSKTLDALQKRLEVLKADPTVSLAGELGALRTVLRNDAQVPDYRRAAQLAETGLGYVVLAAGDLTQNASTMPTADRSQRVDLIRVGLVTAQFAARQGSGVTAMQAPDAQAELQRLASAIAQSKWLEAQLHAANLLSMLKPPSP